MSMSTTDWIVMLLLGGFLGVLGQGVRTIPGLKKVNDQASEEKRSFSDLFQLSRLLLSLFIGFVAGALAVLVFVDVDVAAEGQQNIEFDRQLVLTILGAGYVGTDFIEGFTKRFPIDKPTPPPKSK